MNDTNEPNPTPETRPPQARRTAGLLSRRFLRARLKKATEARATVAALDAATAWFEAQFEAMIAVAIRELEREAAARAKQNVRFRTPPLKRVHLAPFIDPPAEAPRGAVSSIGPQGVEVGRTDTPKAPPA